MPEEQLMVFTGLGWENILELRNMLTSMRSTDTHTVTQVLIVFLFKLRTGNSNKLIAATLGLERQQQVKLVAYLSVQSKFGLK